MCEDVYKCNASKRVSDFSRQSNIILPILSMLTLIFIDVLHKYSADFNGSQVLPMFGDCMQELYTAWGITVCRVWRVPWTTHCVLLPHLAGCMDIELWFFRRCIRFSKMAMKSDNVFIRTIISMGIARFHSVMRRNIRILQSRFKMEEIKMDDGMC